MTSYRFRLLNVFAETQFGGNPLCVFEDGRGLDDASMQALAAQFNLSETTFLLPSERADARVRVFTPANEMRFAGHPALGSAHVVRALHGCGDALTLEFAAGLVPLSAQGNRWQLTTPVVTLPLTAPTGVASATLARLIGLSSSDLLGEPLGGGSTGSDQLMIAVNSFAAVRRAAIDPTLTGSWPVSSLQRKTCYVFAFDPQRDDRVLARYFFMQRNGGVAEDPGTGSACANLGGWLVARGDRLPLQVKITQGEAVGRPCHLQLDISAEGAIHVGGRVIQIGAGSIDL